MPRELVVSSDPALRERVFSKLGVNPDTHRLERGGARPCTKEEKTRVELAKRAASQLLRAKARSTPHTGSGLRAPLMSGRTRQYLRAGDRQLLYTLVRDELTQFCEEVSSATPDTRALDDWSKIWPVMSRQNPAYSPEIFRAVAAEAGPAFLQLRFVARELRREQRVLCVTEPRAPVQNQKRAAATGYLSALLRHVRGARRSARPSAEHAAHLTPQELAILRESFDHTLCQLARRVNGELIWLGFRASPEQQEPLDPELEAELGLDRV